VGSWRSTSLIIVKHKKQVRACARISDAFLTVCRYMLPLHHVLFP